MWTKEFMPLDELLIKSGSEQTQKVTQTDDDLLNLVKQWNEALGGQIIYYE